MHAMVLITFTYGGVGYTVFPLNMVNVILLFMMYRGLDWNILKLKQSKSLNIKIIAFYALILPSLNLIGYYDHLLAFSYFSGKPSFCNIIFLEGYDRSKLPEEIQNVVREFEGSYYININEWGNVYVNLLCYPEDRVYLHLQDYLETFTGEETTYLQYYKK
ncbi:hypothetical protein GCM10022397_04820 [Flavivirga jejuensis]